MNLQITDINGTRILHDLPEDMGLSMMEILVANGCPIKATCGGIALCGTCLINILTGADQLPPAGDDEQNMLDHLPESLENSRLACQLRLDGSVDLLSISIPSN